MSVCVITLPSISILSCHSNLPPAIPTTARFEDYTEVINSLPDSETPETFGLPANIERSVQRANSTTVISQLKVLVSYFSFVIKDRLINQNFQEVTVSEGTRFNREQWATQLSPIIQLWQKVWNLVLDKLFNILIQFSWSLAATYYEQR